MSSSNRIQISDPKYYLVGKKLVMVARKIDRKPDVIEGSSKHRTQRVVGEGRGRSPAKCYIDIPIQYSCQKIDK